METRVEETILKHKKGYNCAQAVACTYCDLVGVDEETMFRLTEALGLGMGGMEGTCGAVTGACVLAGREIVRRFKEQNQSVVCKTLKGVETGEILRACPDCIKDAATILEQVLFEEGEE